MDPVAKARQYKRCLTQTSSSPTRKTAVKFLMTSPENPFGPAEDNDDAEELHRFDSARRHTFGGNLRGNDMAASPESGMKVTMYSNLQEEIKNDALRKSQIAGCNQFSVLLGGRSASPNVSHYHLYK